MSGPQFTPGPWEVIEATEHHGFYVTTAYGNTICDLYAMSNPLLLSTANGGTSKPVPFMHEMDGPNARLIAASPKLYGELGDLVDWLEVNQRRIEFEIDIDELLAGPRAAIAEASGEKVPA